MNNCLLLALISLIVYIPSFNASGSYSSSSLGGRRRSAKGGKTAPAGYGGNDGKGRPTGSGKHTDGPAGSDGKLDKDYRDIIEYISKEFNKDKGSDYTKDKYGLGASYPRGRDDDYRNDDYRNDGYRNGADGGYPAYVPPAYIPYPAPGYSSGGNKGALSSGLLLQLTETIHDQAGSIAALKEAAENSKKDLAELEATQYHLTGYIITLTNTLKDLIGDLNAHITPPSLGVDYYICTSTTGTDCEIGELVAMAGPLTTREEDYLVLADGGDLNGAVCDQLGVLYGDDGDGDDHTCLAPDARGKYLVGAGCTNKDGINAALGECVGSNILDFTEGDYVFPAFPKPAPKPIEY